MVAMKIWDTLALQIQLLRRNIETAQGVLIMNVTVNV